MTSADFWKRVGLCEDDGATCVRAVRRRYVGCEVEEFGEQGYCSYTLLITPLSRAEHSTDDDDDDDDDAHGHLEGIGAVGRRAAFIVQLRPPQHTLDVSIACAASSMYASLAPVTQSLELLLPGGLCAYEMDRLVGTPLVRLLPHECTLNPQARSKLQRLVVSFADFVAHAWRCSSMTHSPSHDRTTRADSPMDESLDTLSLCSGKVGSSIVHRLEKLAAGLPDAWLRERAQEALYAVERMTDYPMVLNHGDFIPSNILVDEQTWEITGMADWAEAEYLPFGTCLYGLEHLLGYLVPASPTTKPSWVYFDNAEKLRGSFWARLVAVVPDLRARPRDAKVMRDVGVLLWHGIAWDDGAINRVVNEVDDVEEITKMRAFLRAA